MMAVEKADAFWELMKQALRPLQRRKRQSNIARGDGRLQRGASSQQQGEVFPEHFQQVLGSGQRG